MVSPPGIGISSSAKRSSSKSILRFCTQYTFCLFSLMPDVYLKVFPVLLLQYLVCRLSFLLVSEFCYRCISATFPVLSASTSCLKCFFSKFLFFFQVIFILFFLHRLFATFSLKVTLTCSNFIEFFRKIIRSI